MGSRQLGISRPKQNTIRRGVYVKLSLSFVELRKTRSRSCDNLLTASKAKPGLLMIRGVY